MTEATPLLERPSVSLPSVGLSLPFASLCMVDLFGVFPVVALSRAVINCGWLGLPLASMVFGLQVYTALLLGRCWILAEKINPSIVSKSRYPYAALAHMTHGRKTSVLVTVLLDVTMFSSGIPDILFASQSMQLFGLKMSSYSFNLSFCNWMLILGVLLCPMMCLGSPKDLKWLSVVSVAAVAAAALLTWGCLLADPTAPAVVQLPAPSWEATAIAYGILSYQFDVHSVLLTIQMDMKNQKQVGLAVLGSFAFTGGLFLITTIIAMVRYGPAVELFILQDLPASLPLYTDLLLITVQTYLSMVVAGSALFQDLEDYLRIPRDFNWKRCVLRSLVVALTVLIAQMVPRLDLIMGLIGGTLTGPLIYVLPPILYVRLRWILHEERQRAEMECREEKVRDPLEDPKLLLRRIVKDDPVRNLDATREYPSKWPLDSDSSQSQSQSHELPLPDIRGLCERLRDALAACVVSVKKFVLLEGVTAAGAPSWMEQGVVVVIVIVGLLATVAATFYNIRDSVRYATFVPPCIVWW